MKKILTILVVLCLCGCSLLNKTTDSNEKYLAMIDLVESYDDFLESSDYFEISTEQTKLDRNSYRFYVVIDKAKTAMYDIEAIAIEKGVDYSNFMAASVGVFEDDKEYSMIPNQANPDKGYVSGLVISGLTTNAETTIYVLVQWKSKDLLTTTRQYLKVNTKFIEDYYNEEDLVGSNVFDNIEEGADVQEQQD